MARFDVLQRHRKGILGIVGDTSRDPAVLSVLLPAHLAAMRQMLAISKIVLPKALPEALAATALLAVYYRTMWRWRRDESSDMAATMATLDQGLRGVAFTAERLFDSKK